MLTLLVQSDHLLLMSRDVNVFTVSDLHTPSSALLSQEARPLVE